MCDLTISPRARAICRFYFASEGMRQRLASGGRECPDFCGNQMVNQGIDIPRSPEEPIDSKHMYSISRTQSVSVRRPRCRLTAADVRLWGRPPGLHWSEGPGRFTMAGTLAAEHPGTGEHQGTLMRVMGGLGYITGRIPIFRLVGWADDRKTRCVAL